MLIMHAQNMIGYSTKITTELLEIVNEDLETFGSVQVFFNTIFEPRHDQLVKQLYDNLDKTKYEVVYEKYKGIIKVREDYHG